jgi:tRNA 5-methylaminomethyl-2-thiouridine biosynthesis bifunctional protein
LFGEALFQEFKSRVQLKVSTTPPIPGGNDEAIVFATGSDPDQLAKITPVRIAPLKGQYLKIRLPSSSKIPAPILRRGNLIPDFETGELWLGATFEREPDLMSFGEPEKYRERFVRLWPEVPEIETAPLESGWQGVRSSSRDHLPVLGRDHGSPHPHQYLFLGNGSKGVLGGYLGAKILAAQILGDPSPVEKSLLAAVATDRYQNI